MPSITNKAYDLLLTTLDHLIKGLSVHALNSRISSSLDKAELEVLRKDLESLRNDYLHSERLAREAYEKFNLKFKYSQRRVSNDCRIIKGIFDPKGDQLRDFGIMPERS